VAALFAPVGQPPAAPAGTIAHTPTLADAIPLSILLAEDNLVNRKIAQRLLLRLGYDAETADNGQDAVARAQAHPFQLILMDLQMPEMDGLEASRRIRATLPPDRQPKIVALTANAIAGDRERCIEAGMDDYITKPVRLHDIEAVIRRQFPA
jgi:CheY-like chemotaxis protein